MIALVLSSAWPRYYASSPFNNLLQAQHPDFKVFAKQPLELEFGEELKAELLTYEAVVVDDVCARAMHWYRGPKLMIGGDPHAHSQVQVSRLELEYASVDYVLTGAVFSKKLPQYHYPSEEARAKHVYFPHSVPDNGAYGPTWAKRIPRALLSGSISPQVYPFRESCRSLVQTSAVDILPPSNFQHGPYFDHLRQYRAGITCNSIFEYTVAKYFEIPWTGAVLLAPKISQAEAELIGFKDGENVYWCRNADEVQTMIPTVNGSLHAREVALNGQDLMMARHCVYARLNYIKALLKKIKSGGFTPEDAFTIFSEDSHV